MGLIYQNIGKAYKKLGKKKKSMKYLSECLSIMVSLFGEDNEYVVETLVLLGEEFFKAEQYE